MCNPRPLPLRAETFAKDVLVGIGVGFASAFSKPEASVALGSDEFEETFQDQAIGIELADVGCVPLPVSGGGKFQRLVDWTNQGDILYQDTACHRMRRALDATHVNVTACAHQPV